MNIYQNVERLDDLQIDQISQIISKNKSPVDQEDGAYERDEYAADEYALAENEEGYDEEND